MISKCFRLTPCDISTQMLLFLNYAKDRRYYSNDVFNQRNYSSVAERVAGTANAEAGSIGLPSRHSPARPMPTTRSPPGSVA